VSLRGSMTDPPLSTMAAPAAANPSRATQVARTAPSDTPATPVTKNLESREFDLAFRAFFPQPTAPEKFNPISAMNRLFRIMLKDEPSLVLRTPTNDAQIVIAKDSLPTGETAFKKYCKVNITRNEKQRQTHVCVGCHLLTNRSIGNIKFHSAENHLLAWLKKERIFIEADSLGTDRPVTIGYFTKIAPSLTHLSNFRDYLIDQLMLVEIDADTAVSLAPHLKNERLEAMTNGDDYIPVLPDFVVYRTRISHGREPSRVTTDVLGVKTAPRDAKLLTEFFIRLASVTNDQRDGIFIPKGTSYLLGQPTYVQMLQENNFFLTNVATIPVNLEYQAWFAIIDPNQTSETDPISIHDHLLRKSWFLRLESVTKNKCVVVTTQSNLQVARDWIDANLVPMIRKSIPTGIDPPDSALPRRLDKPVYSAASKTYADILKQQFSRAPTQTASDTNNNRPPRKRQATILDYDSDQSANPPTPADNCNGTSSNSPPPSNTTSTAPPVDYAAELLLLKREIQALRTLLTSTVEQIKTEIASIRTNPASAMETDDATSEDTTYHNQSALDIPALITELKHDIATVALESRAMYQKHATLCCKANQKIPT